jgi:hypothetical protein
MTGGPSHTYLVSYMNPNSYPDGHGCYTQHDNDYFDEEEIQRYPWVSLT